MDIEHRAVDIHVEHKCIKHTDVLGRGPPEVDIGSSWSNGLEGYFLKIQTAKSKSTAAIASVF